MTACHLASGETGSSPVQTARKGSFKQLPFLCFYTFVSCILYIFLKACRKIFITKDTRLTTLNVLPNITVMTVGTHRIMAHGNWFMLKNARISEAL